MFNPLLFLALSILFAITLTAQITTAILSGTVKDEKGKPLSGAVVTIAYPDAGIIKTIITKSDGSFEVPNLRVGGPYNITASYTGFSTTTESNIFLDLGQNTSVSVQLSTNINQLNDVIVSTSNSKIFNENRTGAAININSRQLRQLPTISRSADDFTRLTPSASQGYNGTSFAGRNGQYNNYSLDGAVFNNPFGLDAPTPGGQTGAQPISLDAIDQIQVNIAPYDVTQAGFTGAGVTPWFSEVDMRILQDFIIKEGNKKRTIQLSWDIINLGNLISSNWGLRKYASATGYYQPITYLGTDNTGKSIYQFDPSQKSTFTTSPDLPSRWQMQFGIRYIF